MVLNPFTALMLKLLANSVVLVSGAMASGCPKQSGLEQREAAFLCMPHLFLMCYYWFMSVQQSCGKSISAFMLQAPSGVEAGLHPCAVLTLVI